MTDYDLVDLTEIADPPDGDYASSSVLDTDFTPVLEKLQTILPGQAARIRLSHDDDPEAVVGRIQSAALPLYSESKTYLAGPYLYVYVNGPQPEEFLRQYALRAF